MIYYRSWSCYCLLFLAAIALGACGGKGGGNQFRVGFSQCGEDDAWRRSMISDMRRELAFYPEMRLLYKQANDSSLLQVQQVKELLKEGIDLLIISPNEAEPLTPVVEEVFSKGIPVIVVDRKTASALYTNYIGANNYEIGKMAGAYARSILKNRGNIIEIGGLPASSPAIERRRGFSDALKSFPNIQITHQLNGGWVKSQSIKALTPLSGQLFTTNLIFAHNDVMALGAYEVCKSVAADSVKIVGVDALPGQGAGMEFVNDKIFTASVLYPTGGAEAIQNAARILRKQPVKKETVLQTLIVDSNNVQMMNLQTHKIFSQQTDIEKQQRMLQEQKRIYNTQRNLLYILGFTLLLAVSFAGLLFYSRRLNIHINRQLERKNAEVSKKTEELLEMSARAEAAHEAKLSFFTNVSHEFRTPLSLILGPLEEVMQTPRLPAASRQTLTLVQKNANRLLRLINQLIDFRKIEFNKMEVRAVETDMIAFVSEVIGAFQSLAHQRNIDCRFLTKERALTAWIDHEMFDKILFNLLSNAFKFTADGGYITLTLEKDTAVNEALLVVEDNGSGMSPRELSKIFDAFYQGDSNTHKGSGLGLPLTRELVHLHHGTIQAGSQKNKGSAFTIRIPLGNEHFNEAELSQKENDDRFIENEAKLFTADLSPAGLPFAGEELTEQDKEGAILIVDDNPEMLQFLHQRLSPRFYVYEADNGIHALQQVFDLLPDLVICDIMMPGKDGIMVASQIKTDVRTAHIPLILLTAKASPEQQIAGLKTAADAYITKPFSFSLLEQTINSLLVNRTRLKEHFSSYLPDAVNKGAVKKTDRKFIADFKTVVEKNISNTEFSVADICREMHVSKIQLYRKIKSLLDTNINEYILNARIQKAKFYLQHEEMSIAEIAYQTGFSSPTYFSTVFKTRVGVTPMSVKMKK